MDIKSLGIGDWVDCEVWDELSMDDIEPIPLTPEFLLKNGFVEMSKGCYVCHVMTGDGYFDIRLKDLNNGTWMLIISSWNKTTDATSMFSTSNAKISVHELQHYIADCKIEKQIVL